MKIPDVDLGHTQVNVHGSGKDRVTFSERMKATGEDSGPLGSWISTHKLQVQIHRRVHQAP